MESHEKEAYKAHVEKIKTILTQTRTLHRSSQSSGHYSYYLYPSDGIFKVGGKFANPQFTDINYMVAP